MTPSPHAIALYNAVRFSGVAGEVYALLEERGWDASPKQDQEPLDHTRKSEDGERSSLSDGDISKLVQRAKEQHIMQLQKRRQKRLSKASIKTTA